MDQALLKTYARFAVRNAINVQKGQTLIINCPIEGAFFARMCAQEAYAAGAKDVVVHYADERLSRIRMEGAEKAVLEDIKPWMVDRYMEYAQNPLDVCRLAIYAEDPEIYKGLDTQKVDAANRAYSAALQPWRILSMANRMQWCVLSIPTEAWAVKVFPDKSPADAVESLWQAIFATSRMDAADPAAAWEEHIKTTAKRVDQLNAWRLSALHLRGENGTDLTVGLADDYLFVGVEAKRNDGLPFLANVPTEEVFCAPHRLKVEGVVKSSLPYVYNGNLIEGITAVFEKGLATRVTAEKGDELMQQMMAADEGARRLGEIALVPASSPIRKTGLLFYNALYDENAACHMAFGAGYPENIQGGAEKKRAKLEKMGLNDSVIHEDIMIGTPKMDIDGVLPNGDRVPVFRAGEWAF